MNLTLGCQEAGSDDLLAKMAYLLLAARAGNFDLHFVRAVARVCLADLIDVDFPAAGAEAVLSAAGHRVRRRREGPAGLTGREVEVLRLLAQGLSNKEIAQRLGTAGGTVKIHVQNILAKLGASDRTHAVTIAVQRGMLHLDA